MSGGVFVTGTDTGIGKTLIACALIDGLSRAGIDTGAFKPIAAGGRRTPAGWRNDDAERLMEYSNVALTYKEINPVALPEAIAPHIAAARTGVELSIPALVRDYETLRQRADFVVTEGAGGWLVPLNDRHSMADLAAALGSPVLLVVGMRLGCLNHALLTVEDIRRRGLPSRWLDRQLPRPGDGGTGSQHRDSGSCDPVAPARPRALAQADGSCGPGGRRRRRSGHQANPARD